MADINLRALLAPRVDAGAKLLDRERPGWADRIDLDRLNLLDSCNCVIGQVYAVEGRRENASGYVVGMWDLAGADPAEFQYGFDLDKSEVMSHGVMLDEAYKVLDELWVEQIRARRAEAVRTMPDPRDVDLLAELDDHEQIDKGELARLRRIEEAAERVIRNAYGATPRHIYALTADDRPVHRDDCIPCGLLALASSVGDRDTLAWLTEQRDRADARRSPRQPRPTVTIRASALAAPAEGGEVP